jgi:hypothetical protein
MEHVRPDPTPAAGGPPRRDQRARGVVLAMLGAAALLAAAIAPVTSATVDRTWRAKMGTGGANGAVTVVALVGGGGTATLRLKAVPPSAAITSVLRAGTCARPTAVVATLPATRSSSSGRLNLTKALAASAVTRLRSANSLVVTIRNGDGSERRIHPLRKARSRRRSARHAVAVAHGRYRDDRGPGRRVRVHPGVSHRERGCSPRRRVPERRCRRAARVQRRRDRHVRTAVRCPDHRGRGARNVHHPGPAGRHVRLLLPHTQVDDRRPHGDGCRRRGIPVADGQRDRDVEPRRHSDGTAPAHAGAHTLVLPVPLTAASGPPHDRPPDAMMPGPVGPGIIASCRGRTRPRIVPQYASR